MAWACPRLKCSRGRAIHSSPRSQSLAVGYLLLSLTRPPADPEKKAGNRTVLCMSFKTCIENHTFLYTFARLSLDVPLS